MRFALINPPWTFERSIYFGCREPHLPLEYGYAKALLEQHHHEAFIVDGQLEQLSYGEIAGRVQCLRADVIVITTAPSYLFWRCAPAELRVPQETLDALIDVPGVRVVIGPHASTTPAATLRKLDVDLAILGEPEEILPRISTRRDDWDDIPSVAFRDGTGVRITGGLHSSDMERLPALQWLDTSVHRHAHHHHRFDSVPKAPGAEMETSRGCPYHCTFCAKENFRNEYRRRPLPVILQELDGLISQGAEYVYFIDEIFLPNRELLEALVDRPVRFGVQTRIDLWNPAMLQLLGAAGCVSIEAGVESISVAGRNLLDKKSRLSTEEITERLTHARTVVPFVQANLLDAGIDSPADIDRWRHHLIDQGVWANKPVPLFPYPGSPDYSRRWGPPDDDAWERAVAHYLENYTEFSDIQDAQPATLHDLEARPHAGG
jgi:B12-binding domain/radical SAM domain protein of rhizo-twelve system